MIANAWASPKTPSSGDSLASDVCVEFDTDCGCYRVAYDANLTPPSLAVVVAVAAIEDVDPVDLDSLGERIDTDALDSLFDVDGSTVSRLSFRYAGFEISVETDGVAEVTQV